MNHNKDNMENRDAQESQEPQEPQESLKVTITLKLRDINLILETIAELPYIKSAGLINDIHSQVRPQIDKGSALEEIGTENTEDVQ